MRTVVDFNNEPNRTEETFNYLVVSISTLLISFIICTFCICVRLRARQMPALITLENNNKSFSKYPIVLTFPQIEDATENFSTDRRFLGKGRFGSVYEIILPDMQVMAVKRIDPSLVLRHASAVGFWAEIRALSRARHPNIVSVLGFCDTPAEKILVMEFMPRKTLQFHLHEGGRPFDWSQRLRIATEAAQGIEYLHEGTDPCIIHGDIKPSNILLDCNWSARVSDFGLSILAPCSENLGTVGDMEPECCHANLKELKASDIYKFGVLLLEILTGRPLCSAGDSIVDWAVALITKSMAHEILDSMLHLPPNPDPLIRAAELACQCVNKVGNERPTIMEVVAMLKKIRRDIIMAKIKKLLSSSF